MNNGGKIEYQLKRTEFEIFFRVEIKVLSLSEAAIER